MHSGQNTWRPITTLLAVVLCLAAITLARMLIPGPNYPRPSQAKTKQTEAAGNTIELHIKMRQIVVASGSIELGSGPVNIPLAPTSEQQKISDLVTSLRPEQQIYLVLLGFSVQEQPGVVYQLYLDLPTGPGTGEDDPHYVGTLNFFNAAKVNNSPRQPSTSGFFRSYDVTDLLKNLQKRNTLPDRTMLTITPSHEPLASAKPTIGRIEMVVQTN